MKIFRIVVTSVAIVTVQTVSCGVAMLPAVLLWHAAVTAAPSDSLLQAVVASALLVPAYIVFALCLMPVSAAMTRLIGARTPPNMELQISDVSWTLMKWVQYMSAAHIVRLASGSVFRGSPLWTGYLRMNGARLGRRVFINTLSIADHNLLELGDDVVIGADVHISGHTVEAGMVKTGRVRVQRAAHPFAFSVADAAYPLVLKHRQQHDQRQQRERDDEHRQPEMTAHAASLACGFEPAAPPSGRFYVLNKLFARA